MASQQHHTCLALQIYMVEIASKGREGVAAAFVGCSAVTGILLGNVAVLIVMAACSPEQLLLWGWRLPFLAVVGSGSLVSAGQT
jgi:MFS family permease